MIGQTRPTCVNLQKFTTGLVQFLYRADGVDGPKEMERK